MDGLLGRLSALIPGAAGMSDEDKRALLTQGLLAFGANTLANNSGNYGKAGPAIGAGLQKGLLAINSGAGDLADRAYKKQMMEMQQASPTEFRALDMQARAAGYEPGTQGYKDFFRRQNGELARQSSAAFGYQVVTGPDGRPQLVVTDPRNPQASPLAASGGPAIPIQGGPAQGGPNPEQDFPMLASNFGAQITSLKRSPEHNREVGGVPNSQHLAGTAGDFVVPPQVKPQFIADAKGKGYQAIDEGDHVHLELPPRPLSTPKAGGVNPFVGRAPEEQAALTTAAQEAAKLQYAPAFQAVETQGAIERAGGSAQAQANVERNTQSIQKAQALQQFEAAKKGLMEGLSGTATGPIAGRIPAVTTGQQIAEGGVAAMAPILKQIFRVAGEGTFTDRDQALLMEMLPTRKDTPEAAAAKLQNIDNIIKTKLGGAQQGAPADPLGIL